MSKTAKVRYFKPSRLFCLAGLDEGQIKGFAADYAEQNRHPRVYRSTVRAERKEIVLFVVVCDSLPTVGDRIEVSSERGWHEAIVMSTYCGVRFWARAILSNEEIGPLAFSEVNVRWRRMLA